MTCFSLDSNDLCYAHDGRSAFPSEPKQLSPRKQEKPPESTAEAQSTHTFQRCLSYDPLDICYPSTNADHFQTTPLYPIRVKTHRKSQPPQETPQADQDIPWEKHVTSKEEAELKLARYIYEELLKYEEYLSSLNAQEEVGYTYDPLSL